MEQVSANDYPEEFRHELTEKFLSDLVGVDVERVREEIKNIRQAKCDPFLLEMMFAHTCVLYADAIEVLRRSMVVDHEVAQLDEEMKANVNKERARNREIITYLEKVPIEIAKKNSNNGRNAAEVLHNRPGGNRKKRDDIRAIWGKGNYSSRDICAEQECASLGMSFSTARKHLRNTPDPT